jgi:putative transposase
MPMSSQPSAGRVRSTYEFIKAHRHRYSVQMMCRVLGVAPSGYYEWLQQPISNRAQEDARLLRLIRASFVASHGIYGAPRVFLDLREAGEICSKHRVARLMREANLRALHGYRIRRWAVRKPSVLIPNLLQRQFTGTRPNKAWVTDITYIRTWQGWLYLAVVMDLFSRLIVGWSAGPTIHRELVLNAVLMAVRRRRPRGTLIHSDQGTQYGSDAWRRFCRSNHLEPSMSRKGNCWDNAVAESFFSSLKKERTKKQTYKNRELAIAAVADYIDNFYNETRRHSHLGGVSPKQFEVAHKPRRQGLH